MQKIWTRLMLLTILALLLLASPALAAEGERVHAARSAAVAWLELLDSQQWTASYDQAGTLIRNAVDSASWGKTMATVRQQFGPCQERSPLQAQEATSLPGVPDGEYVLLTFQSRFERKEAGVESLTLALEEDGQWRVVGYFIQ